ncbi:hypothetical protein IKG48_01445 [Candidatus Saccharibacteria bacterium]|nr:hypothetical protein [Candidatus Saccharibacteria bacterium]
MKEKKSFSPLIIVASIVVLGSLAIFLFLNFLSGHKDDGKNQEGEASQAANLEGEKEREKYPILKNLPIQNAVYTIGYQFESDGTPTIIITATEYYQPFAMEKLKSLGDTSSYRIKIVDPAIK